jgi:hypothetical protein
MARSGPAVVLPRRSLAVAVPRGDLSEIVAAGSFDRTFRERSGAREGSAAAPRQRAAMRASEQKTQKHGPRLIRLEKSNRRVIQACREGGRRPFSL